MRDSLDGYVPRPALPDKGVTFEVNCRTAPGARGRPHPVTVRPDWVLDTPHDLDVERIGVALGGTHTCVTLADRTLPAARALIEHSLRLVLPELDRIGTGRWRVGVPVDRCPCATREYPGAVDAARHLRGALHWARVFGIGQAAIGSLATTLQGVDILTDSYCPLPHGSADGYLTDPDGLDALWDAGVHPSRVPDLVRMLSPSGTPVPSHVVLAHAYLAHEFAWLEQFTPHGPLVVAWAARTRTRRDARRPFERASWLEAGIPLRAVADVFAGDAYTLTDARAYAQAVGVPLDRAARALGQWQVLGTTPTVVELVALAHSGPLMSDAPPPEAVARALDLAATPGLRPPTAVEAALAVALWGNARDAATHLRRTMEEIA